MTATRHPAAHHPCLPDIDVLRIAFVGAGRVARALAEGLLAHAVEVTAVASRQSASAAALTQALPAPHPLACSPQQAVDAAELVFLTVPDDALAATVATLRWRAGQAVVHCSGATEVSVLDPAAQAGALTGGFHPLQIFSDPERAAQLLAGSTVAIEAGPALQALLHGLAQRLGMHPLTLPPGARARYHAAAGYAASFWLPLMQEAVSIWASFGIDAAHTLRALLPLAHGTLATLETRGVAGTLSGPISRGDVGVLRRQLDELEQLGATHAALFRELALRQLPLAAATGRLDAARLAMLRDVLNHPATAGGDATD